MEEREKGWIRWLDSFGIKVVIKKNFCMDDLEKFLFLKLTLKVERVQCH